MSTLELKEKLIRRIDSVDDDNLLKEILHLIEWESGKEKVFKIPEEHKAGIQVGLDQIKSGKTKSHNEVMNKMRSCH